jgi:16S rRNA (uracil1498-N3)-methyltransferase
MKPGEQIGIRDGISHNYICSITEIGTEEICARILSEEEDGSELPARIYLFQGLPKGDKMEWIIQKAVELGAYQIVPVATRRAVVKLDSKKAEAKGKRWNAVAESAAKQSGRMMIPKVSGVIGFSEACAMAGQLDCALIPYELARDMGEERSFEPDSPWYASGDFYRAGRGIRCGGSGGSKGSGTSSHYPWTENSADGNGRHDGFVDFDVSSGIVTAKEIV